jgi:hypothetical protein
VKAPVFFAPHRSAPAMLDEAMLAEERRNPETFAVERKSEWSTSALAYLNPGRVKAMFEPWRTRPEEYGPPELTMQESGRNVMAFYAHGDPSEVDHRFGFSMAHLEVLNPLPPEIVAQVLAARDLVVRQLEDAGLEVPADISSMAVQQLPEHHVVFDLIHFWEPADFTDHHIHYPEIIQWVFDNVVVPFRPRDITFDHFNVPSTVDALNDKIRQNRGRLGGQRIDVHVRNATSTLNWDTYENFKAALNLGLVHAPFHQEASDELKYLQKPRDRKVCAPETGPVTTDDIADTIAITVWKLLDATAPYMARGLAIRPGVGIQGGTDPMARMSPFDNDAMAAVRGQFSAGRARAYGSVSEGTMRSGQPAARGMRPDMMRPAGRRSPITRWR